MSDSERSFRAFPGIWIDPQRAWGNPTVGRSRLPVFKIWSLINDGETEEIVVAEEEIDIGQIEEALGFVEWCVELGLMEIVDGELKYDKDALYKASILDTPPKGKLCMYCGGFVAKVSPAWTRVRDRELPEARLRRGVCHGNCLQAILCGDEPPRANVFPWKP